MLHGRKRSGILSVVFPVIREVILEDSPRLGRPLDRNDIGVRLTNHPMIASTLRDHYHGQLGSYDEWCCNLVDWYSAKWTSWEDENLGHLGHKSNASKSAIGQSPFRGVRRIDATGEKYWLYEPDDAS